MLDYLQSFASKSVLITGGLGFIGSNLAHRLVDLQANVMIVDALIPEHGGNLHNVGDIRDRLRINIADVRDTHIMHELVKNQHYIFNLAGQVSHMMSMFDPFVDLEMNCKAPLSLLEACKHHNPYAKIVFAGTRGQYGRPQSLPVDESQPMHAVDVNGINKTAGEMYHLLYYRHYGIPTTSLRMTNTFGPRHTMKTADQSFLNWFIRLAMDDETIRIFGDGLQRRDFNYVADVVEALLMVAASDRANGEVFNLGGTKTLSILDATKILLEVVGAGKYELVPYPEERKKIEIGEYWGDFTKIRNILGWEPKTSLEEGIRKTVEFYRQNQKSYWN